HRCGDVDIPQLESDEEQEQREIVDEKLHHLPGMGCQHYSAANCVNPPFYLRTYGRAKAEAGATQGGSLGRREARHPSVARPIEAFAGVGLASWCDVAVSRGVRYPVAPREPPAEAR